MSAHVNPVFPDVDSSFMAGAACRGRGDLFFPPKGGFPGAAAKAICASCPARLACDEYAEATGAEGFWAGRWRSGRA